MLKKFIIFFAVFIILLLIISRCSSDESTEQDVLTNVADNAESATGDVAGLAKTGMGDVLDSAENIVKSSGATTEDVVSPAIKAVDTVGSTVRNAASSAVKVVDNAGSTIENVTGLTKDTTDNPLNLTTNTRNAQSREMVDSNLEINSVNFKFNSSKLESHFYSTLDSAVNKINKMNKPIEVAGHADNIGSHGFNMALSLRRATTVLDYLVSKGVDANRLSAKGYGAESPVEDNSTSLGRDANRRVELYKK